MYPEWVSFNNDLEKNIREYYNCLWGCHGNEIKNAEYYQTSEVENEHLKLHLINLCFK